MAVTLLFISSLQACKLHTLFPPNTAQEYKTLFIKYSLVPSTSLFLIVAISGIRYASTLGTAKNIHSSNSSSLGINKAKKVNKTKIPNLIV